MYVCIYIYSYTRIHIQVCIREDTHQGNNIAAHCRKLAFLALSQLGKLLTCFEAVVELLAVVWSLIQKWFNSRKVSAKYFKRGGEGGREGVRERLKDCDKSWTCNIEFTLWIKHDRKLSFTQVVEMKKRRYGEYYKTLNWRLTLDNYAHEISKWYVHCHVHMQHRGKEIRGSSCKPRATICTSSSSKDSGALRAHHHILLCSHA